MSLYSYRCPTCGEVEARFPLGQSPQAFPCACGAEARRVYLSLPVILRPEGWSLSPEDPRYWSTLKDEEPRTRALSH